MTSTSLNSDNSFSLQIKQNASCAKIKMMVLRDPVNTSEIPQTFGILKKYLPSVLATECFNDQNIPFYKEVKKTEIGHLFEHILLEYMCRMKIGRGCRSAAYAGRTRWNWKKDPRGLFHISINCGLKDADILPAALKESIELMRIILRQDIFDYKKPRTGSSGLKNGKKRV